MFRLPRRMGRQRDPESDRNHQMFPSIPLWMGLSAAMPPHWPAMKVYFVITIILSLIGWTDLARMVRGKLIALREKSSSSLHVLRARDTSG